MADIVEFKIEGLEELRKAFLENLPREASMAIREALVASGEIIQDSMEKNAPREESGPDAGLLANNIVTKVKVRKGRGYALIGPKRGVWYSEGRKSAGVINFITRTGKRVALPVKAGAKISIAHVSRFLEFGTSRAPADPFMTRAYESTRAAVQDCIVSKLRERLKL
jgi:HK97 gp10 family phage protein